MSQASLMALSQFFVLSPRGDPIIFRDYRGDVTKETPEIFFRHIRQTNGSLPVFAVDGLHYASLKQSGLYYVFTTRHNVSPSFALELLVRLAGLFKDYCGVLNEESIRKNFVLIYELLDEVLDYGYVQGTSTEQLKAFVFNEPILVEDMLAADEKEGVLSRVGFARHNGTQSASATNKPIALNTADERKGRSEIYVDLIERLTVTINAKGEVVQSEIQGYIRMTSFLQGNPEMRLGLNEDLVIGRGNGYGGMTVDDMTFHECVRMLEWERDRALLFYPPDGEFTVLNYRISDDFRIPFNISPFVEQMAPDRLDLIIKLRLDIPEDSNAANVLIRCPVPKAIASAKCELAIAGVEYRVVDNVVEWTVNEFGGGSELFLRSRITLNEPYTETMRKEFGPISLEFELPMYNCSNMKIRHLRVKERDASYDPYRWVRNITHANSYICRV
jgi:AP-4 complex subunit mu-1